MPEPRFRVQSAPGQQCVFQADGGRFAKGRTDVKLIIAVKKTAVNDVEDVPLMRIPIGLAELVGDVTDLLPHSLRGGDRIAAFQSSCGSGLVALGHFPLEGRSGLRSCAGVRHIKDIPQSGRIAGWVDQRDALRAATHIPPHDALPQIVFRTGGRIRALRVDYELLMVRVLVQPGSGG